MAMGYAFEHASHQYAVRSIYLTPGYRHCPDKRHCETSEEYRRRGGEGFPGNYQRNQRRPKRGQIQHGGGYYRMSAAQADIIQKQTGDSDHEQNGQLGDIPDVAEQSEKVASTVAPRDQQGDRRQQGDLCEAYEIRGTETSGRERRERLLEGQEGGGHQRVYGAIAIIRASGRSHFREAFIRRLECRPCHKRPDRCATRESSVYAYIHSAPEGNEAHPLTEELRRTPRRGLRAPVGNRSTPRRRRSTISAKIPPGGP